MLLDFQKKKQETRNQLLEEYENPFDNEFDYRCNNANLKKGTDLNFHSMSELSMSDNDS